MVAYGDLMPCDMQNECELLLSNVDPLYISDEMDCADDDMSRNMVTVNMSEGGAKMCCECMPRLSDRCAD